MGAEVALTAVCSFLHQASLMCQRFWHRTRRGERERRGDTTLRDAVQL